VTGRQRYARSAKGRKRGSQPKARHVAPVEYGRESFRVTCRRVRGPVRLPPLSLDDVVTAFEWERSGAVMTGALTFGDPALRRLPGLVRKGDVVRCEVRTRPGAAWRALWEMTVVSPTRSVADRTTTLQLRSRLRPAQLTRHHWRFRKGGTHPNGWTADQITRSACARFRVKIGDLPRGRHRITKLVDKSASVVEIVTAAWQQEREQTGRRFDVSIARGVLDVREVRRPGYMLQMGPTLQDAVVSEGVAAGFASAVVVTSTVKRKGSKKRRKLRVLVVDKARVRRYGYVRRHVHKADLSTIAEARRYGKRWLARTAQPWQQITLTHPGIPWVQRGDGVRLNLPDELLTADVWLLGASHRVDPGAYTMTLTATVTDPFLKDARAARVRRRKAEVARARRRRTKATAARARVTPRKAKVRS
jgi:hypothetical protein